MPTRDTAWPAGTPCWVDYTATDLPAAQAFYAGLLDWSYTPSMEEFGGYCNAQSGGRLAAGMMPQHDPAGPSSWTTYFATDNIASLVDPIAAAGGTVVSPPMAVAEMGTMLIALDPGGHPFGAWQAGTHTGVQVYNQPGALTWNEEAVADPDAARAFYGAVFGFSFSEIPESGGYTTFATDGDPLGGLGGAHEGSPSGWTTCFAVADADAAAAYATGHGGSVISPPMDMPYGRYAVLADPWGAALSIMQLPN